MKRILPFAAFLLSASVLPAATVVDVTGVGVEKTPVQISVANPAFAKCLAKNLELSGLFSVGAQGAIRVTGSSGALRAEGRGKSVVSTEAFADDKSARMAARRLADSMCEAFFAQKGFACDRVLFLNRGRQVAKNTAVPAELCVCYPDGYDIRQLTNDRKMIIFQRWMKDAENVLYISDMRGSSQIWQMNTLTGQRKVLWSFKGSPTGIAVSPDGRKVAAILSFQGNPELYVIDIAAKQWTRLTTTPFEVEGQPTFSPDGSKIAFVRGDKSQQIWVVDLVTRKERRLTSRGRKNVDPDWGSDGRIAYISGAYVAVMDAATGDRSSKNVAEAASWEHPSWSRDGRHLVANRNGALFLIDTLDGGDRPRQVFRANGNWISPCWMK